MAASPISRGKKTVAEQETILGIPPVVVVEPVDVGVPPVVIAVDVENRDALCHAPSMPLPFEYTTRVLHFSNTEYREEKLVALGAVSDAEPLTP